MATLTIENIDDDVVRRIEQLPREELEVMNRRLKVVAESFVYEKSPGPSRREIADRIRAMTPKGLPQTDSVLLLREDRDR